MIPVTFLGAGGRETHAEGVEGARLLDVAQAAGQPLEGTCDGDLACATCHVVVDAADFARLSPASSEEEDLLDLAPNATRTSRLACQIRLSAQVGAISVRIPG